MAKFFIPVITHKFHSGQQIMCEHIRGIEAESGEAAIEEVYNATYGDVGQAFDSFSEAETELETMKTRPMAFA